MHIYILNFQKYFKTNTDNTFLFMYKNKNKLRNNN